MGTIAGINYTIVDYEDGQEWGGGPWINVGYQVAWPDRFAFVRAMMSKVSIVGTVAGGPIITYPGPITYPESPSCVCTNMRLRRWIGVLRENDLHGADADFAEYTAEFRVPPIDLYGSNIYNTADHATAFPYTSLRKSTSLQAEELAQWSLVFEDPAEGDMPHPFTTETPVTELIFTRHLFPYIPGKEWDDFVGTVNLNPFFGYDTGQVKYNGLQAENTISVDGQLVNEIQMSFLRKPRDWNSVWSGKPGSAWKKVWSDPTNQVRPYPYADFDVIFNP